MCNVIVQYIYAATSKFFEGMLPPPFCEGKTTYNIQHCAAHALAPQFSTHWSKIDEHGSQEMHLSRYYWVSHRESLELRCVRN
jgi:hypothetical protein